jgi:diguanylate cyclase
MAYGYRMALTRFAVWRSQPTVGVSEPMGRARSWWDQPDHFEWVGSSLRQRGLLGSARWVMALIAASSSLVPLTVLLYPTNLGVEAVVFGVIGAAFSAWMTGYWLTRWPSRLLSEAFAILGSIVIVGWSMCQPIPALGALECTAMAVTGGYIAFFHSTKLLAANLALATLGGVVAAFRLASETSPTIAAAAFWLVWLLNLAIPLGVRAIAYAMRAFAERAEVDPLTGLLNRRGFLDRITADLATAPPGGIHLTVLMVDLDDFKAINDGLGHAAGDQTLIAVADLIRKRLPGATICRAGGEEFLIAHTSPEPLDAAGLADQLCHAIATLPGVTASIGTATRTLTPGQPPATTDLLAQFIDAADHAMYYAKRRGGNQTHHA